MPRTTLYLLLITTVIGGGIAFLFAADAPTKQQVSIQRSATPVPQATQNYKETIAGIETQRINFASRYLSATTGDRAAVIAEARTLLTQSIYNDLFPAWYGTPWDFNGTSEVPQQGKIACGYFVSTILRDAGWKVERVRLAQQASENIILSLTTNRHVKRFRRVAIGDFVEAVKQSGPGIYIVGLDIHVGFIVNTGDEVYFIHSSYVDPYTVVQEKAIDSRILAGSNYRVLGNVLADDELIANWLAGKTISTKVVSETRRTN